jgi:hypothetical protein
MYYSVAMAWGLWIPGEVLIVFVFHGGVFAAGLDDDLHHHHGKRVLLAIPGRSWKMIDLLEREPPFRPAAGGAEAMAVVE